MLHTYLQSPKPWIEAGLRRLRGGRRSDVPSTDAGNSPLRQVDLLPVLKASQEISGEIRLDRLVHGILTAAVRQAGSRRGLLILPQSDEHGIAAQTTTGGAEVAVTLGKAFVTPADLPLSLFHHVVRTGRSLLLEDASTANPFSQDDYLRSRRPRSILCLPLMRGERLMGVLYLEGAPAAPAPEHAACLELLAAQAAISLENALLYADLQRENDERQAAEEIDRSAPLHDALTGLPGRALLEDRTSQAILQAARNGDGCVAVLFLELDRFQRITEYFGRSVGEELVRMTAQTLAACLRKGDSIGRLEPTGGRFMILLPVLPHSYDTAVVAQKLLDGMSGPFMIGGRRLQTRVSIGIGLYPNDGTAVATLMQAAATAMGRARQQAESNYQFSTPINNVPFTFRWPTGWAVR